MTWHRGRDIEIYGGPDRPSLFELYMLGCPLGMALRILVAFDRLTPDERCDWDELTEDERRVVLYRVATRVGTRSALPAGQRLH